MGAESCSPPSTSFSSCSSRMQLSRSGSMSRCVLGREPNLPSRNANVVALQLAIRIEGKIRGFDEFMNLVVSTALKLQQRIEADQGLQIDDAIEVRQITKTNDKESRKNLGQILLKGDNVSLIQSLSG